MLSELDNPKGMTNYSYNLSLIIKHSFTHHLRGYELNDILYEGISLKRYKILPSCPISHQEMRNLYFMMILLMTRLSSTISNYHLS